MPRKTGPTKANLSVAVLPETRQMLIDKSEACGQTMSELVQVAVVEKYSPRRGLANRLRDQEAEAKLLLSQELETIRSSSEYDIMSIESKLTKSLLAAEELAVEAKALAEGKLTKSLLAAEELATEAKLVAESKLALAKKQATERFERVAERCARDWDSSIQKVLLSFDFSNQDDADRLNLWLFEQGIWATAAWNSQIGLAGILVPRFFGSRAWHGYASVFLSPMFPDRMIAADVAAELQTWTASPEYRHWLLQHYNYSASALYSAFVSEKHSDEYAQLIDLMRDADVVFGTDLATVCNGY